MLCLATVLTIGLSHTAAQACVDIIAGGNAYGNFDCRLMAYCDGYCYYNCKCSDVFGGKSCDDVLIEAGFILGDSPRCIN